MKGEIYLKVTPEKEGTLFTGHCIIEDVNYMDKLYIIDNIAESLHMSDEDIMGYYNYRKVKKITPDD